MLVRTSKRLLQLLFVLWGVSTLVFLLTRVSGNPAAVVAGPQATRAVLAETKRALGLDHSLIHQYLTFIANAAHFDFGNSFTSQQPAMSEVTGRLGASARLAGCAALITLLTAIPLGVAAAVRGGVVRRVIYGVTLFGQTVPGFVLGLLLILIFAVRLHWLPSVGDHGFSSLILPTITLAAFIAARQTRLVATYMLEELDKGYVRTARANGFSDRRIYLRALRNALIPIFSLLGLDVAEFFAGAIIVETIFAWPGVGSLMVQSVLARDYPVIQAGVFLIAVVVVCVNLGVDLLYGIVDPRLRAEAA